MVIGMTGSGKTFFAEKILAWRSYVIVYDLKGEIKWNGYKVIENFSELEMLDPEKEETPKKIIYKPSLRDAFDEEAVDNFFKWVYLRRNTTLYIDELMSCCFDGKITFWLQAILTRGRELGISCIGSTQRPKRIPLSLLSESESWVSFRIQLYDDAKRVEQSFGIPAEQIQNLPKRYFYYGSINNTYPQPFILRK